MLGSNIEQMNEVICFGFSKKTIFIDSKAKLFLQLKPKIYKSLGI